MAERRRQLQPPDVSILATLEQDVENSSTGEEKEKETIEILDVSDCAWFLKMVVLMVGFALFLIASWLYNFPASPIIEKGPFLEGTDMLDASNSLGAVVAQYTILFSLCGFIVIAFASVCLAIRMKAFSDSPSSIWWRSLGSSLMPLLREFMWGLLLLSFVAGVVVFDWYIFDGSAVPFWVYLKYIQFSSPGSSVEQWPKASNGSFVITIRPVPQAFATSALTTITF